MKLTSKNIRTLPVEDIMRAFESDYISKECISSLIILIEKGSIEVDLTYFQTESEIIITIIYLSVFNYVDKIQRFLRPDEIWPISTNSIRLWWD